MDLLNRVLIAGRLTRDPEVRETASGKSVAELSLAMDPPGGGKSRDDRDQSSKDDSIFVDVVVWERTAETAGEYLKKGSAILIEGRLRMDCWEDRETGKLRRKLKVAGERMRFLDPAPARSDGDRPQDQPQDREDASREISRRRDVGRDVGRERR
jgi:single-strand DNA-binding protein